MDLLTAIIVLLLGSVLYGIIGICKALHNWHHRNQETKGLPDMPGSHWLWGTRRQENSVLSEMSKSYKAFRHWIGPMMVIRIIHPEPAKKVLASSHKGKSLGNKFGNDMIGNGLLLANGALWHRNRKLLTPAFHFNILKSYIEKYNAAIDLFFKNLEGIEHDKSVDICQPIHLLALDIIMRCAFSRHDDVQIRGNDNSYVEAMRSFQQLFYQRMRTFYHLFDFIYHLTTPGKEWKRCIATAHQMSGDIIRRRMALEENPIPLNQHKCDFLSILLTAKDEDGTGLTEKEIRDEIDTFLFGGHDTSSYGISFLLYCLAKYPKYQKRCQQEVDQLFTDRESDVIQWEDLSKVPYLTRCLKEALRLYPSVHAAVRVLREPLEIDGVTLPVGITVYCDIYSIHRNVNVWGEDCQEFRPDRFLRENMIGMDSHAFLGFSAGPRNCIGQNFAMNEMKTVVSRVLRRYWLEVDDTHDMRIERSVTLMPVNGIKLRFVRRSPTN